MTQQQEICALIEGKSDEERIEVSVALLRALVGENGNGNAEQLLSTQQVADILGVSRPFVVKLIDGGQLPAQFVGTHRRVRAGDLELWKAENRRRRLETLSELARLDRELGL